MSLSSLDMTLYHKPPSRSVRVAWLAAELGILSQIKIEEISLFKGEQYRPPFRSINPMSAIPTLIVRDSDTNTETVMTESGAICVWLSEIVPAHSLKPPSTNIVALGQYHRFVTLAAASIDALLWDIRMNEVLLPPAERTQGIADRSREKFIKSVIPTLEGALGKEGVQYICEPYFKGFTTADVMVGYALYWASSMDLISGSPILQGYVKRIMDRPAFKEATRTKSAM